LNIVSEEKDSSLRKITGEVCCPVFLNNGAGEREYFDKGWGIIACKSIHRE
jgi:hypothetical protein